MGFRDVLARIALQFLVPIYVSNWFYGAFIIVVAMPSYLGEPRVNTARFMRDVCFPRLFPI